MDKWAIRRLEMYIFKSAKTPKSAKVKSRGFIYLESIVLFLPPLFAW